MKIYNWKSFLESITFNNSMMNLSDILESLTILEDSLLSSINAREEDIFKMFSYLKDNRENNIEDIISDTKFNEILASNGLKKGQLSNTDDYETFLNRKMYFLPIYNIDANELMNPLYLMIQVGNDVRIYSVNNDIKNFYDKLTSKTIEISKDDENWIYSTSNSGNNWELMNTESATDIFKNSLYPDELRDILNSNNYKISLI